MADRLAGGAPGTEKPVRTVGSEGYEKAEWARASAVDGRMMLSGRGWTPDNLLVVELQTGETTIFRLGGMARADLDKHVVWVCPMFEPFLTWLYRQDLADLEALPTIVEIPDPASALRAPRRPGVGRQPADRAGSRAGGRQARVTR